MKYTVRMAVKTPSLCVQYRMLEADVSVSDDNPKVAMKAAGNQLVIALTKLANIMGEQPPEEIYASVEQIYGPEKAAMLYGLDTEDGE